MDIRSLVSPIIRDPAGMEEFRESLSDLAPQVEQDIARLKAHPGDREVIGSLFRAMHNIKGDAALCKVDLAVALAHPVETVLSRLRNGEIQLSDTLAELILLATDRLELAIDCLLLHKPLENLRLVTLIQGLEKLAQAPAVSMVQCAADVIEQVTGFRPAAELAYQPQENSPPPHEQKGAGASADLRFFRSLADQFEARSPLFRGRTQRLLRLALETNRANGTRVDPEQLEAAVYLHDVGMMFLPESVWLKMERMTLDDKLLLRQHPAYAAGLLSRMDGWGTAAEMIAQHHEMPDGEGYPAGIKHAQIHDGAKILAIVDAFEAVMLKHIHRGKNRSVLRAIAEINACDKQFAPEWIEPFNRVIRRTVENQ